MKSRGDFPRMSSKVVCISNVSFLVVIQIYFQPGCFLIVQVMFLKKRLFFVGRKNYAKGTKKIGQVFFFFSLNINVIMKGERFF